MKRLFVIQPNFAAKSEVWLHRMNTMLQDQICGMAAYLRDEEIGVKYPVFNLNGRRPNKYERWLIRLRLKGYDSQKTMYEELDNTIIKAGTDVLIIHYATTADYFWKVIGRLSLPVFIYVHGHDIIWDHNDNYGNKLHPDSYSESILNISRNKNVKFITSSNCGARNLESIGIDKSKIVRKIFGVELPVINRNYCNEELKVLFLGRLVDYKGPDVVVEAFLLACDMGFKGQLVVAGDGPLRIMCELISKRSKYSDRIKFVGAVDRREAIELFEGCDVYSMHNCVGLLSKGYDTFGVSIIEAMSYGLPIVITGVGGPSEIIDNNVNGIIVEANNIIAHADAFMRLYKNKGLRSTLGKGAREKVLRTYTTAEERKQLYDILQIEV